MFRGTDYRFRKNLTFHLAGLFLALIIAEGSALCADPALWTTLEPSKVKKEVVLTNETVAELVERLKPAVVNISVTEVVTSGDSPHGFNVPGRDEEQFREFWRRFFGNQEPKEFRKKGLGSGFIINKDGYIVTNNHVVQKAKDITVILQNKDQYPAKVIGSDPKVDVALIKIDAKRELVSVPLGDSDKLRDGEAVLAIGNPFGLAETVTSGIVSAKGRTIGAGPYDDFIQTDASINPGNSGGPLMNFHGEVVGINTAIVASAQGIGFAVPINLAKEVLLQLNEKGRVVRGWLGVSIQEITPELAKSFGLSGEKGALVSDVAPGGPAEAAGFKRGDVILEVNGRTLKDYHELPRVVASMSPGEKAAFRVLREGKEISLSAIIAEMKDERPGKVEEVAENRLGITLQAVTPEIAAELGMKKAEGVVVTEIVTGGPAAEAGMQRGDVILEVERQPAGSVKEFNEMAGKARKSLLLLIYRNGSTFYISVKLPQKEE
ncbi:MAG TPA: DegQ family serine endoprotease [Thermodesulfovibrionales bacterium]|nr:DegQ family serine endoprotease [Thermodesulfovibrionales bacterium]